MGLREWMVDTVPLRALLLVIGTLFHLCYVLSIFDIYFRSPVIHGMTPHRVSQAAPARRLVLIVGDGLRADKLFQYHADPQDPNGPKRSRAPYLRSIAEKEGTFGVSHTRVPTESRPGHVALIAGMYEDVSAVTRGWKENPVNFDSVFNQSRYTWALGSPDIIKMFQTGASDPKRVTSLMYGAEDEDFTKDPTELDRWVFREFDELLARSKQDKVLDEQLRSDQVVFFLHLLGLDTSGHAFRPYSEEYLHNIEVVDQGLRQTVSKIEDFFGHDGATSYIFTADHGMSDRGNHGDGDLDNTRTPLIAWGAGLHTARYGESDSHALGHDDFSADWRLDKVERFDVQQADIAPLMSTLVGLNHPVNNVGELPLDYLDMPDQFLAEAALVNAQTFIEQYILKSERKQRDTLFYKPYAGFVGRHKSLDDRLSALSALVARGDYEQVIMNAMNLNKLTLEGIRYLDTYDRFILRVIVTSGYLGWMIFASLFILKVFVIPFDPSLAQAAEYFSITPSYEQATRFHKTTAIISVISMVSFFVQRSPLSYYLYVAFPIFYLDSILLDHHLLQLAAKLVANDSTQTFYHQLARFIARCALAAALLQCMVVGYFDRRMWTAGFGLLGLGWPITMPKAFLFEQRHMIVLWIILCAGTGIFTLLPVELAENLPLILSGGIGAILISSFVLYDFLTQRALFRRVKQPFVDTEKYKISGRLTALYFISILLAMMTIFSVYQSVASLRGKRGLPPLYQALNWASMILSLLLPFLAPKQTPPSEHLFLLALSFVPSYVILTESYEGLFYISFICVLVLWCTIETRLYAATRPLAGSNALAQRPLALDDVRIGLFFLFFIHVGFFGTGNVASISSFYLNPVYRLIPTFQPFPMAALLIYKMLIPFIVICTILGILTRNIDVDPFGVFMVIFVLGDVLSLNFFYLVRDEGSWLDIGQSISHFIISSFFTFSNFIVFSLVVRTSGTSNVREKETRTGKRRPERDGKKDR